MNKNTIMETKSELKTVRVVLTIICIHCYGLVASSLLENIWNIFIDYEYLPWTRLIVIATELRIATIVLDQVSNKSEIDQSTLAKRLASTLLMIVGSQLCSYLKPDLIICGFSVLDGTVDIILHEHYKNTIAIQIIETEILIIYTLLQTHNNTMLHKV